MMTTTTITGEDVIHPTTDIIHTGRIAILTTIK
jgi:hypothetical protein